MGVFPGDDFLTNPHGEFSARPFDELRIQAGLLFDCGCHTGSMRTVVSDPAIANTNILHDQ
ncbi:MAG TPA: hypothetical protein VH702_06425, partial [Vicinamibacterales bacterium]